MLITTLHLLSEIHTFFTSSSLLIFTPSCAKGSPLQKSPTSGEDPLIHHFHSSQVNQAWLYLYSFMLNSSLSYWADLCHKLQLTCPFTTTLGPPENIIPGLQL
jgi:hypothetical protein